MNLFPFIHWVPAVLFPASLLAGAAPLQDAAPLETPQTFTEKTWASCAECHAAPDARVEHDARWIGLNQTTACLTGKAATQDNRRRLMAYLRAGEAPLPVLVRASVDPAPQDHGYVNVPATSGSAFLRRTDSKTTATKRLFWEATKTGTRLALPEGSYELVGYSFYREKAGVKWTAAATVQDGEAPDAIKVSAREAASLAVEPTIYHDLSATADGPNLSISFQMRNEAGDRMTLTQDGALVEPTWFATDNQDKEVASGRFVPT